MLFIALVRKHEQACYSTCTGVTKRWRYYVDIAVNGVQILSSPCCSEEEANAVAMLLNETTKPRYVYVQEVDDPSRVMRQHAEGDEAAYLLRRPSAARS